MAPNVFYTGADFTDFVTDFVIPRRTSLNRKSIRIKDGRFSKWPCSWWRHQMETCSALLALCAGDSPVTGEFPSQRPVTRSFDVFFDRCPNKHLWGWWFETSSCSLWRYCNGSGGFGMSCDGQSVCCWPSNIITVFILFRLLNSEAILNYSDSIPKKRRLFAEISEPHDLTYKWFYNRQVSRQQCCRAVKLRGDMVMLMTDHLASSRLAKFWERIFYRLVSGSRRRSLW